MVRALEAVMAQQAFFSGFSSETRKNLADCGKLMEFEPRDFLAREGSPAKLFYVIELGVVAISANLPHRGEVVIQTLHAGDVVGWSWLFPPYLWTFDVVAMEPTRALGFEGRCVMEKCHADISLGYQLLGKFAAMMHQRLKATRVRLLDIYRNGNE